MSAEETAFVEKHVHIPQCKGCSFDICIEIVLKILAPVCEN